MLSICSHLDFVTKVRGTQHSIQIHGLQSNAITSGIFPEFKYAIKYDPVFIQTETKVKTETEIETLRTGSISSIHVSVCTGTKCESGRRGLQF